MNLTAYIDYLVKWLEEKRQNLYKMQSYTLGISGGIDSAVCAHLIKKTNAPIYLYALPSHANQSQDLDDAKTLAEQLNTPLTTLSIDPLYQLTLETVKPHLNPQTERENVLKGNLMARLRMILLYTLAQSQKSVVIGTDNLAETYTGYFTKYGDGAADLLPLANLRKEEVYQLGKHLGVPKNILAKAPSAGLWQGQTDEDELGFSYKTLDAFLRGETITAEEKARINYWHERSHHKRILPPSAKSITQWQQQIEKQKNTPT